MQEGVVGRAQLLAAEVGRRAIDHRVNRKRLLEVLPGVYAVGHRRLSRRGWMHGALLFGGEESALSHCTAGEVRGVMRPRRGRPLHVTIPRSHRPHPWVLFHRSKGLEIETVAGLRVTTLERTLLDAAATESQRTVELAINEAIIQCAFDLRSLDALLRNSTGHPGLRTLKAAARDVSRGLTPTDGEAAEALHDLLRRSGFEPRPLYQPLLLGYQPDFLWPEHRLVLEADGGRFHSTPYRRRKDREKDARLGAAGYRVLRFTYFQIVYQPDYVLQTIRAALTR